MTGPGYETPSLNPQSFSYTPMKFDPGSESELRPGSSPGYSVFLDIRGVFCFFYFSLTVGAADCPMAYPLYRSTWTLVHDLDLLPQRLVCDFSR
jgi:hypothetical protein